MQSLSSRWKQFHPFNRSQDNPPIAAVKNANEIDSSPLKSVIKTNSRTSTKIDMMTDQQSEESVKIDLPHTADLKNIDTVPMDIFLQEEARGSSSSSLLNMVQEFIQSTDSLNEMEEKAAPSLEKLPTNLLLPSILALHRSFIGGGPSIAGSTVTCGSEFHDKWSIPDSIEQVKTLCETERLEGTPQSQLALCLHLMESAWQADPENNTLISPEPAKNQNLFSTLLPHHAQQPGTLGEAMVMEARQMLKQLANSSQNLGQGGEAEAQFLLACCYGMGALGWPVNHYRAFQWYNQASKQNHPEATYRTAVCYELGIGTEKDGGRAIAYYRKATHLSHVPSMYKLGVILMRGYCGNPVSKREAVVWLQRAASTAMAPFVPGDDVTTIGGTDGVALPHALHALAMVQLTKECDETSMIPDPVYAIKLLHNASRLGYAPSQSKLGECYECGHFCAEDEPQSIYWYTLAAEQDYPEACLALSGWYLTGSLKTNTLKQSDSQAYLWARKAASLAKQVHRFKSLSAKTYYTLGLYHENGIGVPKSIDTAVKWYKKAAHYGHVEAIKLIRSQHSAVI
ncbi:hypothetical protein INT47_010327 [Mucor saturninus]|uniref:HCP-like protein n=1 Tax=Mucor saturninus TaxID=64648 RepID=A0A8H7QJS2_9FUNG|nr:hypothetical protein INT47_010327 [Mucor saturninus]